MIQKISPEGIDFIREWESCSLTVYHGKADKPGVYTVGWGHKVTANDSLKLGDTITQARADDLQENDLQDAEISVCALVHVPLNQNQFDALTSLIFNCGSAPLREHLGQFLNAGNYQRAANTFLLWDHANGVEVDGLADRRQAEMDLFNADIVKDNA